MADNYQFDDGDVCEIPGLADSSDFDGHFFQALDVVKSHGVRAAESGGISGISSHPNEPGGLKAYSPPADQYGASKFSSFPAASISSANYSSSLANSQSTGSKKSPVPSPCTTASRFGGGGDKCPRCEKNLYFAEAREGPNNIKYHKGCFSCATCRKTLSDSTFSERQGEVYCKVCYARDFGPKGFGFGGLSIEAPATPPAATSYPPAPSDTGGKYSPPSALVGAAKAPAAGSPATSSPPPAQKKTPPGRFGGGDTCVRCQKAVYFAEAREGPNNNKYHKSCFACATCQKVLDTAFAERQGEVYCKPCYGKEFGPKGFGFGTLS
jgi:cysteine and glycine-rich protein